MDGAAVSHRKHINIYCILCKREINHCSWAVFSGVVWETHTSIGVASLVFIVPVGKRATLCCWPPAFPPLNVQRSTFVFCFSLTPSPKTFLHWKSINLFLLNSAFGGRRINNCSMIFAGTKTASPWSTVERELTSSFITQICCWSSTCEGKLLREDMLISCS